MPTVKDYKNFVKKYNKDFSLRGYSKMNKTELKNRIEAVLNQKRDEIKNEWKALHSGTTPKPAAKPEAKPAAKPAAKPEAKPEAKPAAKPAPKPVPKPSVKTSPKSTPKTKTIELNIENLKKVNEFADPFYYVDSLDRRNDKDEFLSVLLKSGSEMTNLYNKVIKNIDTVDKKVEYKMFELLFNILKNNQKFAVLDSYNEIIMYLLEAKPEISFEPEKIYYHGVGNKQFLRQKEKYILNTNKKKSGVLVIILKKDKTIQVKSFLNDKKILNLEDLKDESSNIISLSNIDTNYPQLEFEIAKLETLKKKLKFVKNENTIKKYNKLIDQQNKFKKNEIGNKKIEPKVSELIKKFDNEVLEIIKLTKEKLNEQKKK
jgi:hypothetical protein